GATVLDVDFLHAESGEFVAVAVGQGVCLSLDLRYNWGLTDIFDFHPDPDSLRPKELKNVKLTNHCLQLSLGYNLARTINR
ncbi:MAG: hypothetical protein AAF706_03520, partial [Bacteroidota bacterium]